MDNEKQKLLHAIEEEWEQMTLEHVWELYGDLYEERDIKEFLYSRFFDDVADGEEEELQFLLGTMNTLTAKGK